jgi:hypothetical protein
MCVLPKYPEQHRVQQLVLYNSELQFFLNSIGGKILV